MFDRVDSLLLVTIQKYTVNEKASKRLRLCMYPLFEESFVHHLLTEKYNVLRKNN